MCLRISSLLLFSNFVCCKISFILVNIGAAIGDFVRCFVWFCVVPFFTLSHEICHSSNFLFIENEQSKLKRLCIGGICMSTDTDTLYIAHASPDVLWFTVEFIVYFINLLITIRNWAQPNQTNKLNKTKTKIPIRFIFYLYILVASS